MRQLRGGFGTKGDSQTEGRVEGPRVVYSLFVNASKFSNNRSDNKRQNVTPKTKNKSFI